MTPAPERTYGRRELVWIGVMRLAAAPLFAGLNALAGGEFTPLLVAIILLAVPYGTATIWIAAASRWERFDPRVLIPLDLVVMGAAMGAAGGADSQVPVIFYLWTIGMALLYPPRVVVLCAVGAVATVVVSSIPAVVDEPANVEPVVLVASILAWVGLLTWCVADVFRRRAADIEHLSATRRRLLSDALGAEERARRRLSGFLQHETLQVLLAAGQDLDAGLRGGHPWIASRARERIRLAVRSLRDTVRTLHPAAIAEVGLAAAIDAVVERAAAGRRATADVRVDPAAAGVNDSLVVSLVRELSVIAAREQDVRAISAVVARTGDEIEIVLVADGAPPTGPGRGAEDSTSLGSTRERIETAGGTISVEDRAEGGTRIAASLPVGSIGTRANGAGPSEPRARSYGRRELRYFSVVRLISMPLFSALNAIAGTALGVQFWVAVVLSLVYGVGLVWWSYSEHWDRIDARWFALSDLVLLGLAITVTGGPESQLRAVFFVWPIALSMLFPPRIVIAFAVGAMATFAAFSLPEVLAGGETELRALGTFELSFVWINMMSWFVAGSFWQRRTRIERLSTLRQRLLSEALNAEDRARRRLSQSLHDDALQVLLAAGQDLDGGLRGDGPMMNRARGEMRLAVRRLQDVIRGLDPSAVEFGGLAGGVDAVVEEWAARGGFSADVRVDPEASGQHDGLVISIVRELASNAAKHAEASEFSVELARNGDSLDLIVADNGRGMGSERPGTAVREGHIGLASCRERVEVAGGELDLASGYGAGTRVSIRIPDPRPRIAPEPAAEPAPAEYAAVSAEHDPSTVGAKRDPAIP